VSADWFLAEFRAGGGYLVDLSLRPVDKLAREERLLAPTCHRKRS
jgi:hypothetical protein